MNKKWYIGILVVLVGVMAVGYAALAQELNIFGTSTVTAEWNMEITRFAEMSSHGITTTSVNHVATSANFNIDLAAPGSTATYEMDITNNGTIDAEVSSIVIAPTTNLPDVSYEFSGLVVGDKQPAGEMMANNTRTATLVVTWDPAGTEVLTGQEDITVTVTYVQDTD